MIPSMFPTIPIALEGQLVNIERRIDMSHFTKVATKINDIKALENALSAMGLKLQHNIPCRYFGGTKVKENVAKLSGMYDVAFFKNSDGTYSIDADFFNGYVENEIGIRGSTLMRQYTIEKLKIEARKKRLSIHDFGDGRLKLYDATDSSGAYVEATIASNGNISFKAKGFVGGRCMSFAKLEDAFGVASRKTTEEYHMKERDSEVVIQKQKE